MPIGSFGVWELVLVLLVVLFVFGAKRLPELGGALGKGIREFKGSVREIESEPNPSGDASGSTADSGGKRSTAASDASARKPQQAADEAAQQ